MWAELGFILEYLFQLFAACLFSLYHIMHATLDDLRLLDLAADSILLCIFMCPCRQGNKEALG
jgi:hypothetical protein